MFIKSLISVILLFCSIISFPVFADDPNVEPNYVPGEVLVQFAPQENGQYLRGVEKEAIANSVCGGTIKDESDFVPGLSLVTIPDDMTVEQAIIAFENTLGVLYAQPNYLYYYQSTFPNDPCFPLLYGLHNTGQTYGTPDADIDAPEAWDISTDAGDIIVAVIDSGIDYTHPDLAANMWHNPGEKPGNGFDDEGNGYVDDIYGYDFCTCSDDLCQNSNKPRDSDPNDEYGHGTHCAGIIGAVGNNSQGVTGVCWNVKIMALKFCNYAGYGKTSDAVESIGYAVSMGAKVLSNSWGWYKYDQALKNKIEDANAAGVLFVSAAGNAGYNNDTIPNPAYPASYDCNNIIAVMATGSTDTKASLSNWGPNSVDLAAPGSSIYSCLPGGGYDYLSGTSMSAPYVSGAAALVWAMNPALSHLQVKDIILNSADRIQALNGLCVTGGRLNLHNALCKAFREKIFKMTDDVNDGVCVRPGEQIIYTISFASPPVGDPGCLGPLADVNIIDYLPNGLDIISSSPGCSYDSESHTITWHIGTILPGDANSISITTKVSECMSACGVITNRCEVKIGNVSLGMMCERVPVCCAGNPTPIAGGVGALDVNVNKPWDVNLVWCKGRFAADANGHDVYFGTDIDAVSYTFGPADLTGDGEVNLNDLDILCQQWLTPGPQADIYPDGSPDGIGVRSTPCGSEKNVIIPANYC